jgi:peptidoglycan/LPS O-acetylase OafA/YrhL
LRFVLASSVIVCHCYAIFYGWEQFVKNGPFMKWTEGKISIGSATANFFFVISGFLIVRSIENSANFMEYIKKRTLHIYPGFIAVFIFCFLMVGPIDYMKSLSLSE